MSDNNELPNADKVVALNEANAAAGLPPVSTNLRTPTATPEDTLSPIYPKMSEIVDAAEHGNPIPVNDAVEVLEKPSPDGSDAMRKLMDTVQEEGALEGEDVNHGVPPHVVAMRDIIQKSRVAEDDDEQAVRKSQNYASAAAISSLNAATTTAGIANTAFASIGKLKRHVRDLRIGFVVLTVVLVGDIISHLVA